MSQTDDLPESTAVVEDRDGQSAGLKITESVDQSKPFKTTFICLVCGKEYTLTVPARISCSRCKTVWMIDQTGQVIFD